MYHYKRTRIFSYKKKLFLRHLKKFFFFIKTTILSFRAVKLFFGGCHRETLGGAPEWDFNVRNGKIDVFYEKKIFFKCSGNNIFYM